MAKKTIENDVLWRLYVSSFLIAREIAKMKKKHPIMFRKLERGFREYIRKKRR